MRKVILAIVIFLSAYQPGYCAAQTAHIALKLAKPEIFVGEPVMVTFQVTNSTASELSLIHPGYAGFYGQWVIDNSRLQLEPPGGGVEITSEEGRVVTLKPGESYRDKVEIYIVHAKGEKTPQTFRMGLKATTDAAPIWSNPVTVGFKEDEALTVKVEATLKEHELSIKDVQHPSDLTAHLRIVNTGSTPQQIGMSGDCGVHELKDLISDNPDITIASGFADCLNNIYGPSEITLKPGEVYEQDARVMYEGENYAPDPITFRIGIKSTGHVVVWGDPVTIHIVDGTPQWEKHIAYWRNVRNPSPPPQNGILKKYYETGELQSEETYKDGKLNGLDRRYYQNGKLWQEIHYKDGKFDGEFKEYREDGGRLDEWYSYGAPVSYIYYRPDGSVQEDMKFMEKRDGKWVKIPECTEGDSEPATLARYPRCDLPDTKCLKEQNGQFGKTGSCADEGSDTPLISVPRMSHGYDQRNCFPGGFAVFDKRIFARPVYKAVNPSPNILYLKTGTPAYFWQYSPPADIIHVSGDGPVLDSIVSTKVTSEIDCSHNSVSVIAHIWRSGTEDATWAWQAGGYIGDIAKDALWRPSIEFNLAPAKGMPAVPVEIVWILHGEDGKPVDSFQTPDMPRQAYPLSVREKIPVQK